MCQDHLEAVTKKVTGCLRMTKDTIFVVFKLAKNVKNMDGFLSIYIKYWNSGTQLQLQGSRVLHEHS